MSKIPFIIPLALATFAAAKDFHVSTGGSDSNPGTDTKPFKTISAAANIAQPGDVVTVHAGVYRERINPPRGGTSPDQRIVYQAAQGEKVEIKGSEQVKGWVKVEGDVWKVTLPNSFFGKFNPYNDLIRGDWFNAKKRNHHTGAVYLNGEWLVQAAKQEDVLNAGRTSQATGAKEALWFATVDESNTVIWAQFKGVDPNDQLVEINVRQTVFYPDQPGRNFITVRGFTMRHAATPWAPPTAEQIGLIGTHWSKGWIIENNTISHSVCSGVALGKHGDKFDNTSANSAEGYVKTIERAHAFSIPWTKENIGQHTVRNNTISHCEQTGIVGSLGCSFSTVTGNTIHDIHIRQLFTGAEMAGIKFHGAIDTIIGNNHIYRCNRGIWLDWMTQGTRVTGNLLHDNPSCEDLFIEVNHGPFLIDNNILLSPRSLADWSQGGAYVHNLFAGKLVPHPELRRETPWLEKHGTKIAGLKNVPGGDNRFYNNIFVGAGATGTDSTKEKNQQENARANNYGLSAYDESAVPQQTGGNVHFNGAKAYGKELNPLVMAYKNPGVKIIQQDQKFLLQGDFGTDIKRAATVKVTTDLLGKTRISDAAYENADGSPLTIDTDYLGNKRDEKTPSPGPFEITKDGQQNLQVWPKP